MLRNSKNIIFVLVPITASFLFFNSFASNLNTLVVITVTPQAPSSLTATAASPSQINLSWTDNSSNETGFQIERKQGISGAYSQIATTSVNIAVYSDNGLSASTYYIYRVRAYNSSSVSSYSNESGATTLSSGGGGGGGGGGGWSLPSSSATAVLIGKAYPKSVISILVDGVVKATVNADSNASFNTQFEVLPGIRSFSVYSTDLKGRRSLSYTFTLSFVSGTTATVSGIFLAPTIEIDKSEVKKGDIINVFGQTVPLSTVSVLFDSEETIIKSATVSSDGTYFLAFNSNELQYGDHSVKSQSFLDNTLSAISQILNFKVGERSVVKNVKGDLNKNGRVNIIDFSIMLYWWGKTTPQALDIADINGDKKINLIDLSIMLYYWTG
ncbi:MAG: dockerin type I domain-containing protein [Patescibacteria group bacterium]|nr:dockerin type I domain-containing protein [Patescibacteria group bacterium]